MKHHKKLRRLGVDKGKRKALLKSLNTALALHGSIQTTVARAKELKREFDKLITLGKRGNLHSRKSAYAQLNSEKAVYNIFDVYAPQFKERKGGYTRIYKLRSRLGDNSEMAMIQLVDLDKISPPKDSAGEAKSKKKSEAKKDTLSVVKEDLQKGEPKQPKPAAAKSPNKQQNKITAHVDPHATHRKTP